MDPSGDVVFFIGDMLCVELFDEINIAGNLAFTLIWLSRKEMDNSGTAANLLDSLLVLWLIIEQRNY